MAPERVLLDTRTTNALAHARARAPTATHPLSLSLSLSLSRTHTHTYTHTHTQKYVILIAFPRQQCFRERVSMLRYTYITYVVELCRCYFQ
jgi:hypothetical protein